MIPSFGTDWNAPVTISLAFSGHIRAIFPISEMCRKFVAAARTGRDAHRAAVGEHQLLSRLLRQRALRL